MMVMMFWFVGVVIAILGYHVDIVHSNNSNQFCPEYSATFVTAVDTLLESPMIIVSDPEFNFLKEVMGFREDAIQHTLEDAFKFFNDTYGLDFSLSSPNENNEYFFENAKLRFARFPSADGIYNVIMNNWVKTGSTHLTCQNIHDGLFEVTFSGDQLLHGSYGGIEGLSADISTYMVYGFSIIDVCDQSPIIIQIQSAIPFRREPIDGTYILDFDLYSRVLGYGKASGLCTIKPDPENPGKYRYVNKNVFTFGN